jgi:hypothetical protein
VRIIGRTVGPGKRGLVTADQLLGATGCADEDLWTLFASLERLDVIRVYGRPERAGPEPNPTGLILDLGVRASGPDWSRARRLREAGAEALRTVRKYATTPKCRRWALLRYFGDDTPTCVGCDVCGDTGVGTAVMGRGYPKLRQARADG